MTDKEKKEDSASLEKSKEYPQREHEIRENLKRARELNWQSTLMSGIAIGISIGINIAKIIAMLGGG